MILSAVGGALSGMLELQHGVLLIAVFGSDQSEAEVRLRGLRIQIGGFGQRLGGFGELLQVVVREAEVVEHLVRMGHKLVDALEHPSSALVFSTLSQEHG